MEGRDRGMSGASDVTIEDDESVVEQVLVLSPAGKNNQVIAAKLDAINVRLLRVEHNEQLTRAKLFNSEYYNMAVDATIVVVARAVNTAVAGSISPETSCVEADSNSSSALGFHILYASIVTLSVLPIWCVCLQTQGALANTIRSGGSEMITWAWKEVVGVLTAMLASSLKSSTDVWSVIGANYIFVAILTAVAVLTFYPPLLPTTQFLVARLIGVTKFCCPCFAPPTREQSDDMAADFLTAITRVPYATALNNAVLGTLGQWNPYVLRECWPNVLWTLGAILFGDNANSTPGRRYFKEWWATITGLSFVAFRTVLTEYFQSWFGLSSLLDELVGALIASFISLLLLRRAVQIRVTRKFCCYGVSFQLAHTVSYFQMRAAAIGFGLAWDDFGSQVACASVGEFGDSTSPEVASHAAKVDAYWVYAAFMIVVGVPLATIYSGFADKASADAEAELMAYEEAHGMSHSHQIERDQIKSTVTDPLVNRQPSTKQKQAATPDAASGTCARPVAVASAAASSTSASEIPVEMASVRPSSGSDEEEGVSIRDTSEA